MAYFNATDKAIASFVYASVLVFGTFGNLVILISILFRREARRKQSNIFLVSLSLTDFLTSIICGPYYLRSLYVSEFIAKEERHSWLCSIVLVTLYYLSIESIISLALISLDRCFAIRMPFWYQRWVTRRSCVVAVCFSWVYNIVTVFPPVFKSDWIIYENHPGSPCGFQWEKADMTYIVVIFLISFFIPTIVICITNVLVFKTAKEQNRRVKALQLPGKIESRNISNSEFHSQKPRKSVKMDGTSKLAHENVERISLDSHLALRPVSATSTRIALRNTAPGPAERQEARELSFKSLATLQDSMNPSLPTKSKHSHGIKAQTNDSTLEKLTQIRASYDFEDIEGNATSSKGLNDNLHQEIGNSQGKHLRQPEKSTEVGELKSPDADKNETRSNNTVSASKEMKLVLATISISIAFFITWMPFVIPRIILFSGVINASDKIMNYGTVFTTMSSAWNPYIIILTRREIFVGFKAVMKQLKEKIFR